MIAADPTAALVLVHDDGPCANGELYTPLAAGGLCPVCGFAPDMQSTSFKKAVGGKK